MVNIRLMIVPTTMKTTVQVPCEVMAFIIMLKLRMWAAIMKTIKNS